MSAVEEKTTSPEEKTMRPPWRETASRSAAKLRIVIQLILAALDVDVGLDLAQELDGGRARLDVDPVHTVEPRRDFRRGAPAG